MQGKEETSFSKTWHEKLFPHRVRFRHNSNISVEILEKLFLVPFKSWDFKVFLYENFPSTSISALMASFYSILWVFWCWSETISIKNAESRSYFDKSFDPVNLIWVPITEQRSTGWSFLFNTKGKGKKKNHCLLLKGILLEWGRGMWVPAADWRTQSLNNFFKLTLRCIPAPKPHPLLIIFLNYWWAINNHKHWIFSEYKTV